jgi:tetratricopeptide (TPR) repeat protein
VPDNFHTWSNRAGDRDGAIADYRRATELAHSPTDISSAWYGVGLANERAGRKDDAREVYLRALEVNPENGQAKGALARIGR